MLKSSVAAAVSALTHNNYTNQIICLKKGLIKPVVELLKSRNMTVQLKCCLAIESLAMNNQLVQDEILKLEAESYMIRLLEVRVILNDIKFYNFILILVYGKSIGKKGSYYTRCDF